MNLTVVTTCVGRLRFLRQCLPTWRHLTDSILVATSDSCPDQTSEWCKENQVPCVKAYSPHEPVFNKPAYLNVAMLAVKSHFHPLVLLLDADTRVYDGFRDEIDQVPPGHFAFVQDDYRQRDLTGVLLVEQGAYWAAGGMDEGMRGWGAEDIDLRMRLRYQANKPFRLLQTHHLGYIEHSDELRTARYEEQNLNASNARNAVRMMQTYHRLTGKQMDQELASSTELQQLLGIERSLRQRGYEIVASEVGFNVEEKRH